MCGHSGRIRPGFPTGISSERLLTQLADAIAAGFMSEVMEAAEPGELTLIELELARSCAPATRTKTELAR